MRKYKKRVREISLKYSSLSGQISSKKLNQPIQFESSLERDLIYLLEFDTGVKQYLEQPLQIKYFDLHGQPKKYTPDFIISYHDENRKIELIEVKYENDLIKQKEVLDHKHDKARQYCKEHDMVFKIFTEKYIREKNATLLSNVKFLSHFRDYYTNINYKLTGIEVNTVHALKIMNHMRSINESTVNELINFIEKDSNDKNIRAKLIFLIWYLIANNFIHSNLELLLDFDSKIWISL